MKNRMIRVAAILAVLGSLYAMGCKKSANKIRFGAVVPLTGSAALWGTNSRNGALLAVEETNKNGGINGKKVELIVRDSKGKGPDGVRALTAMLAQYSDIVGLVDDAVSSVALAEIPIITKEKLPMISTGSTNPSLSGASPFFFRVWNSDAEEAKIAAKLIAKKLGFKKGAIIYINNDYGVGLKKAFTKAFQSYGGRVLFTGGFAQGATSFRSLIDKVSSSNPEFIYLIGYPTEIPIILKTFKERNFKGRIIGTVAFKDDKLLKIPEINDFQLLFPYPASPPKDEKIKAFEKAYTGKFGKAPGITSYEGYDAMMLLIDAVRHVGPDRVKIRDYLRKVDYKGVSGQIKFDSNGDVHKPFQILRIKDGKFVPFLSRI